MALLLALDQDTGLLQDLALSECTIISPFHARDPRCVLCHLNAFKLSAIQFPTLYSQWNPDWKRMHTCQIIGKFYCEAFKSPVFTF